MAETDLLVINRLGLRKAVKPCLEFGLCKSKSLFAIVLRIVENFIKVTIQVWRLARSLSPAECPNLRVECENGYLLAHQIVLAQLSPFLNWYEPIRS
jgi:hypothetical protein